MSAPSNTPLPLPLWEYAVPGPLRDRLCGLTLAGAKTATFDVVVDGEISSQPGQQFVMVGTDGSELAIIEVLEVLEMTLDEVPWALAEAEGESFVDLEDWTDAHVRFFASVDLHIAGDSLMRCERFRVLQRLPDAAGARYPVVEVLVPTDDVELASTELVDYDTIGIEEIVGGSDSVPLSTNGTSVPAGFTLLRAGFANDEDAVAAEAGLSTGWWRRYEVLLGNDWLDAWRDEFQPVSVGRLVIWPTWIDETSHSSESAVDSQLIIRFDPGRAWGTGAHESTQLALQLLQSIGDLSGKAVFDAGCGSGILGIAAVMLGAQSSTGVDVDMASPGITIENAQRNGVGSRLKASTELVADVAASNPGTFDVVLANILAPVLVELAPDLLRLRSPGAPLILAGLVEDQVDRVLAAFSPLICVQTVEAGSWRGLLLNKLE